MGLMASMGEQTYNGGLGSRGRASDAVDLWTFQDVAAVAL